MTEVEIIGLVDKAAALAAENERLRAEVAAARECLGSTMTMPTIALVALAIGLATLAFTAGWRIGGDGQFEEGRKHGYQQGQGACDGD